MRQGSKSEFLLRPDLIITLTSVALLRSVKQLPPAACWDAIQPANCVKVSHVHDYTTAQTDYYYYLYERLWIQILWLLRMIADGLLTGGKSITARMFQKLKLGASVFSGEPQESLFSAPEYWFAPPFSYHSHRREIQGELALMHYHTCIALHK